ncbi:MAG: helicase-related protein [Kiritimatiellia bacterium]
MFAVDFLSKLFGGRKNGGAAPSPSAGAGGGRGRRGRHGRHAGNRRSQPPAQKETPAAKGRPSPKSQQSPQPRGQQAAGGSSPKGQKKAPKQNQPPRPPRPPRATRPQPPKPQTPAAGPERRTAASGAATSPAPAPAATPAPATAAGTASAPASAATPAAAAAGTAPAPAPAATPAPDGARQFVYVVRADVKFTVLVNLLRAHARARTVVFCNKKMAAEDAHRALAVEGFKCGLLTGDVNEDDRAYVLRAFAAGEIPLVVVTDGFDAGIHAGAVDYVVNYDFPYEAADYVRRIGNVGTAENAGQVISFADEDESFAIPEIEEHLGAPLVCRMLAEDDPLLASLAAAPAADGPDREPEPAYARIEGGIPVFDAQGREGRVVLGGGTDPRPLPTFETALDPKADLNEIDAYLKAASGQGGEWTAT